MIDWLIDWSVDWLIDWSIDWLIDWSIDWLIVPKNNREKEDINTVNWFFFVSFCLQELFERILFIWALRNPASGYVQGINDLVTPYFLVFLHDHVPAKEVVETYDCQTLSSDVLIALEADCFWCLSKLLAGIQVLYSLFKTRWKFVAWFYSITSQLIDWLSTFEYVVHSIDWLIDWLCLGVWFDWLIGYVLVCGSIDWLIDWLLLLCLDWRISSLFWGVPIFVLDIFCRAITRLHNPVSNNAWSSWRNWCNASIPTCIITWKSAAWSICSFRSGGWIVCSFASCRCSASFACGTRTTARWMGSRISTSTCARPSCWGGRRICAISRTFSMRWFFCKICPPRTGARTRRSGCSRRLSC